MSKKNLLRQEKAIGIALRMSDYLCEQKMELLLLECGMDGIVEGNLCGDCREKVDRYLHVLEIFRERFELFLDECMADEVGKLRELVNE